MCFLLIILSIFKVSIRVYAYINKLIYILFKKKRPLIQRSVLLFLFNLFFFLSSTSDKREDQCHKWDD